MGGLNKDLYKHRTLLSLVNSDDWEILSKIVLTIFEVVIHAQKDAFAVLLNKVIDSNYVCF